MPRPRRYAPPGAILHVVNRGNEKRTLFAEATDYDAFLDLMAWAKDSCPINLLAYCLMPNHWHLVISPVSTGGVSRYVHRVCPTHAVRLRGRTGTTGHGHVYQQRYHSSLVDSERYYYQVLRYVEANAMRAGLVERAGNWRWSSLRERTGFPRGLLDPSPLPLPTDWAAVVEVAQRSEMLAVIRTAQRSATIR